MDQREALVLLNLSGVIGAVRLRRLVAAFGSPEAAIGRTEDALRSAGLGPESAKKLAALRREELAKELRAVEKRKIRLVTWYDGGYPAALKNIYDPPLVLYCHGELAEADALSVAIVGSRRASLYGLTQARSFAQGLAEHGITVVSGMARGIDTHAHAGALERGGRTIAVMGSGFNRIYPPENRKLAETIAGCGCVVSEFPMDTGPLKPNFPRRNRLISGLSLGVLVVEAAPNSGALITADFALEQGREVFAVPGRIDSPGSAGAHGLIGEGAKLVSRVEDIIEEFPFVSAGTSSGEGLVPSQEQRKRPVGGDEKLLYDIISGEGLSVDELTRRSGMPMRALTGLLLKMQLSRLIKRLPGNRFSRTP